MENPYTLRKFRYMSPHGYSEIKYAVDGPTETGTHSTALQQAERMMKLLNAAWQSGYEARVSDVKGREAGSGAAEPNEVSPERSGPDEGGETPR